MSIPEVDWARIESTLEKMEQARAALDKETRTADGQVHLAPALLLMARFATLSAIVVKLLGVPDTWVRLLRETAKDFKEEATMTWTTPWEFLKMTPQMWGGLHPFVDMTRDAIRFTHSEARQHKYGPTCRHTANVISGIRMWAIHLNQPSGTISQLMSLVEVTHKAGDVDPRSPMAARVAARFLAQRS
jgi:hypothetical protein